MISAWVGTGGGICIPPPSSGLEGGGDAGGSDGGCDVGWSDEGGSALEGVEGAGGSPSEGGSSSWAEGADEPSPKT